MNINNIAEVFDRHASELAKLVVAGTNASVQHARFMEFCNRVIERPSLYYPSKEECLVYSEVRDFGENLLDNRKTDDIRNILRKGLSLSEFRGKFWANQIPKLFNRDLNEDKLGKFKK